MNGASVRGNEGVRVVHRDNPSESEVRRRLEILAHAHLPRAGRVEAWAGERADEVRWRVGGS